MSGVPVHRKRVIEWESVVFVLETVLNMLRWQHRSLGALPENFIFGFWQKLGFTSLWRGGGGGMCNMLPEIFRKFFQIFQISGAGDAVEDVNTKHFKTR